MQVLSACPSNIIDTPILLYEDVVQEYKTVISIDLGAATLRMRLSRFAPDFPLKTLGEVILPLDALHHAARDVSPEELLAGPKRLLEHSGRESGANPEEPNPDPRFCPNPNCGLARREWPAAAVVCALCGTRLVTRSAIVAEELVGHAMARARFDLERAAKGKVQPDIALASAPIDWNADVRYRYLDFLKSAFPGADVRLVDDPMAIARDAVENPDDWRLAGVFAGDRLLVIDSGARRTQFYTAVASPRIGFFDPAYAAEEWGGADCDQLIIDTVAAHLGIERTAELETRWARSVRLWKEGLSESLHDPRVSVVPLHLPLGDDSAETLAVGPPAKETAAILAEIERRVDDVVARALASLGDLSNVQTVLLAGGNRAWPYFDNALRRHLPNATLAAAPTSRPVIICGLPCNLIAESIAWKLSPRRVKEEEALEAAMAETETKHVPTITELFAAPKE
jgi:hypothetical protein